MWNHFDSEQYFLKEIPEFDGEIDIDKSYFADCAICLGKVYENEQQLKNCKHVFHKDCIQPWLRSQQICPICREDTQANELEAQPQIENPEPNNRAQRNAHRGFRGRINRLLRRT
uniref:RING-type domain-containing protein n=1 Tax=Meloidogyne enterolobii TaxID=390850 RepID=A0A6V7YDP4_MELEN|nr:unnamed protein product [Meloidogyne enterolobii]